MSLGLVPNFPLALRLEGLAFLVLGAGRGVGRQVAHALRQFGAQVYCCDADESAAEQVAFEVSGMRLDHAAVTAPGLEQLLASLALDGVLLGGVVDVLDGGRQAGCAARARAAARHCSAQGAGSVVMTSAVGNLAAAEGRFADLVAELAEEFADDGVRVNGVVPAAAAGVGEAAAAGIVAFLCSRLAGPISGQVLLAGGIAMDAAA
jgi:NAD(P)-dependent dehydrogenase (short-subunit alcohol dehydrogenase family)